jgi:putative hydrolase of the HAD superfamily
MVQNKIKAVIFDIGRVLVDVNLTNGIFKFLDLPEGATDLKILNDLLDDKIFIEFSKGKISSQDFYNDFISKTSLNISYDDFVFHWQNIFKPIEGMDLLCEQISKKYEIGILSDIDTLHWQCLKDELAVFKDVKTPTLSYEVGFMKPQSEIYEIAVKNVAQLPQECLFIDDREMNVKGAIDFGMQALNFEDLPKLRKDLQKMRLL